jgi:hypothetical protein
MKESKEDKKDKILHDYKEKTKNEVDIEDASKIISGQVPEYRITINDRDHVEGLIFNGPQASVLYDPGGEHSRMETIARFTGNIGPVVKVADQFKIQFNVNNAKNVMEATEAANFISNQLALSQGERKKLITILNFMVQNFKETGNFEELQISPVAISDDCKIQVKYAMKNNSEILKILTGYLKNATNQRAYLALLGFLITSLLHYDLKTRSKSVIQVPLMMFTGPTGASKTSLAAFFISKGFEINDKSQYLYPYERIRTQSSFNNHLSDSYVVMLLDDTNPDWVYQHEEQIKDYGQTAIFASRGKRSGVGTNEFYGLRSFIVTMNDNYRVDHSLATSNRFVIVKFTIENIIRKNKESWNSFKNSLPDGFMLSLMREIFDGMKIDEVLAEVEQFATAADFINYGLRLLNNLNIKYGIPEFPYYMQDGTPDVDSYAYEVAEGFISEHEKIENSIQGRVIGGDAIQMQTYRSPMENQFIVENEDGRIWIYFTSGAFKILNQQRSLKMPYATAADFVNNVKSSDEGVRVENNALPYSKKFGRVAKYCYVVSLPDPDNPEPRKHPKNEVDPELQKLLDAKKTLEDLKVPTTEIDNRIKEYKAAHPGNTENGTIDNIETKNPSNSDIDSLPAGPVKESLIEEREEQEHKATRTPVNESEHASMIMDYRYNNKDSEILYYRLNKDFNKFDGAFFYGSSIIVDSIRNIRVPGTSEIAYVLYKLRIPKHATDSDYPKGWLSFTTSAEPLNEKAYNALSKGDQK